MKSKTPTHFLLCLMLALVSLACLISIPRPTPWPTIALGSSLTTLTPTAETTTRIYPSETALSPQTTPGGTHPAEPTPENLRLPEGVSLYPGAYDFFWVPGMGAPMVCYAVDETPEKVQKFYENDLALHGWSLLNTEPTKPGTLSQNWRKGGVTLNVMLLSGIADDPNGTYVSLTWP